ncbi:MAG: hypothetical protein ACP5TZ_03955 [Nitrososphaeria archaeon]
MNYEPFLFKSYNRVIGTAHNLKELESEIKRLSIEDPACVEYHLKEGHIVQWLSYIDETDLSKRLNGVSNPRKALHIIFKHDRRHSTEKTGI